MGLSRGVWGVVECGKTQYFWDNVGHTPSDNRLLLSAQQSRSAGDLTVVPAVWAFTPHPEQPLVGGANAASHDTCYLLKRSALLSEQGCL